MQKHQPLSRIIRLYISSEIGGKYGASYTKVFFVFVLFLRMLLSVRFTVGEKVPERTCVSQAEEILLFSGSAL